MFWVILIVLCLAAVLFAVWPLWRKSHRLTPAVATIIVLTVGLSAGLYNQIGSPGIPSGRASGNENLPHMEISNVNAILIVSLKQSFLLF